MLGRSLQGARPSSPYLVDRPITPFDSTLLKRRQAVESSMICSAAKQWVVPPKLQKKAPVSPDKKQPYHIRMATVQ